MVGRLRRGATGRQLTSLYELGQSASLFTRVSIAIQFTSHAGLDAAEAAQHIAEMHGPSRIPTLLKRVDQLCRGPGSRG